MGVRIGVGDGLLWLSSVCPNLSWHRVVLGRVGLVIGLDEYYFQVNVNKLVNKLVFSR